MFCRNWPYCANLVSIPIHSQTPRIPKVAGLIRRTFGHRNWPLAPIASSVVRSIFVTMSEACPIDLELAHPRSQRVRVDLKHGGNLARSEANVKQEESKEKESSPRDSASPDARRLTIARLPHDRPAWPATHSARRSEGPRPECRRSAPCYSTPNALTIAGVITRQHPSGPGWMPSGTS